MIEPLLYFALGFLCAAFLAALVAPAVWRRAVMLTRRRIEASVPLTLDEIRAEKDSLRAEHAVVARRLEMEVKKLKQRSSEQSIKHARDRKDMKAIASEREANKVELTAREAESRQLRDELRRREDAQQALSSALQRTEETLQTQRESFAKLAKEYEEIAYSSSARQIELVARESEIDRLNSDIAALRGQRKNIEKLNQDVGSAVSTAQRSAETEKRRADALDARLVKLTADITDKEERLERRDREIARLRERLKPASTLPLSGEGELRLVNLQAENMRLEARLAELTGGERGAMPATEAIDALKQRVAALLRENRRLREQRPTSPDSDDGSRKLREQMQELAAQVVDITAKLEGENSPIEEALNKPASLAARPQQSLSLADRIRALRDNAPS